MYASPLMDIGTLAAGCAAGAAVAILALRAGWGAPVRKADTECESAQEALRAIKALRLEWEDVLTQIDRATRRLARYRKIDEVSPASVTTAESPSSSSMERGSVRRTLSLAEVQTGRRS